jgi:general secretion pathway protein K
MAAIATALGPAQASATIEKSKIFRILTRVNFDNGRRTSTEVVIGLKGGDDPYRVLSWQDHAETAVNRERKLADNGDDL